MSIFKKILTAIVTLFILGAIPLTTLLLTGNLDFRKSARTEGATFTLDPKSGQVEKGSNFEIRILLDTHKKSISGGDVALVFDKESLAVTDDDENKDGIQIKANSLLENPLVMANKVTDSKIYLSVNSFTPFTGAGVFGTIKFQALKTGSARVGFSESETKITQQGTAQNLLVGTNSAEFTVEEKANSATEENQTTENNPENTNTDLNADGKTDDLDMQLFAKKWGAKDQSTDLNRDGIVDQKDLDLFTKSFKER